MKTQHFLYGLYSRNTVWCHGKNALIRNCKEKDFIDKIIIHFFSNSFWRDKLFPNEILIPNAVLFYALYFSCVNTHSLKDRALIKVPSCFISPVHCFYPTYSARLNTNFLLNWAREENVSLSLLLQWRTSVVETISITGPSAYLFITFIDFFALSN